MAFFEIKTQIFLWFQVEFEKQKNSWIFRPQLHNLKISGAQCNSKFNLWNVWRVRINFVNLFAFTKVNISYPNPKNYVNIILLYDDTQHSPLFITLEKIDSTNLHSILLYRTVNRKLLHIVWYMRKCDLIWEWTFRSELWNSFEKDKTFTLCQGEVKRGHF